MIMTAALELAGNQVTHFYSAKKNSYSAKKNSAEMIRMMELLVDTYCDRRKLYLSWDAASWHISKRLYQRERCDARSNTLTGPLSAYATEGIGTSPSSGGCRCVLTGPHRSRASIPHSTTC
jgi:hypothetical protein